MTRLPEPGQGGALSRPTVRALNQALHLFAAAISVGVPFFLAVIAIPRLEAEGAGDSVPAVVDRFYSIFPWITLAVFVTTGLVNYLLWLAGSGYSSKREPRHDLREGSARKGCARQCPHRPRDRLRLLGRDAGGREALALGAVRDRRRDHPHLGRPAPLADAAGTRRARSGAAGLREGAARGEGTVSAELERIASLLDDPRERLRGVRALAGLSQESLSPEEREGAAGLLVPLASDPAPSCAGTRRSPPACSAAPERASSSSRRRRSRTSTPTRAGGSPSRSGSSATRAASPSSDADPVVRWHAAVALGDIGHPDGLETLVALTEDGVPFVRAHAAIGLAEIGDERGLEAVERVANDEAPRAAQVGSQALKMLRQILAD